MTDRELKKMSRADLLELMVEQGKELEEVKQQLEDAKKELENRRIALNQAGSIAEASLSINGVFAAAQAAADEYLLNIKDLNDREEAIIAERERESREKAEARVSEAEAKSTVSKWGRFFFAQAGKTFNIMIKYPRNNCLAWPYSLWPAKLAHQISGGSWKQCLKS